MSGPGLQMALLPRGQDTQALQEAEGAAGSASWWSAARLGRGQLWPRPPTLVCQVQAGQDLGAVHGLGKAS